MSLKFVLIDIPFRLVQMRALISACEPLMLRGFHRSLLSKLGNAVRIYHLR